MLLSACASSPQGLAHPKPATIVALDGASGSQRWSTKSLPAAAGLLTEIAGRLVVEGTSSCGGGAGELDVFDAATGKPSWTATEQRVGYSGALRSGGATGRAIVVVAGVNPGVPPGAAGAPPLGAPARGVPASGVPASGRDVLTGAVVWSTPLGADGVTQGGDLAVATTPFGVVALDVASGRVVWQVRSPSGPGGTILAGPVLAAGSIESQPDGRVLGQVVKGFDALSGTQVWTVPVAMGQIALASAGGVVVIEEPGAPQMDETLDAAAKANGATGPPPGQAALRGIDAVTGAARWRVDLNALGRPSSSDAAQLVAGSGLAITPLGGGRLGAFALADGRPRWTAKLDGAGSDARQVRSIAIGDGRVIVGAGNDVTALDEMTGRLEWRHHIGDVQAVAAGSTVYAAGLGALAHCTPD